MKAVLTTEYGPPLDVLRLKDVATPEPSDAEVLVKLFASSVNPLDDFAIKGPLFFVPKLGRLLKPAHGIAGADYAGIIELAGRDVKRFRRGDAVFGASFMGKGQGGFAEYVCAREDALAPKPKNLSFAQAAAVPVAAITALQGLRDHGQVQPGQNVLIDGASGGVGTFAIQIAKAFGANVTAVCSTRNIDRARAIGADHVVDYTRVNFTRRGLKYDLIFGANAIERMEPYPLASWILFTSERQLDVPKGCTASHLQGADSSIEFPTSGGVPKPFDFGTLPDPVGCLAERAHPLVLLRDGR